MTTPRRSAILAVPLLLVLAVTAAAGPPWIAIEYPVNPHDPETRDALLVIRTYHHQASVGGPVTAEAIGMVDGRRATLPLQVTATSRAGVYAVRGDLTGSGDWVVAVRRGAEGAGDRATALVAMTADHEVLAIRVPTRTVENGQWVVPREPTGAEVETLLRTATAMSAAARRTSGVVGAGAALLLLLMVPSGGWLLRRERSRGQ